MRDDRGFAFAMRVAQILWRGRINFWLGLYIELLDQERCPAKSRLAVAEPANRFGCVGVINFDQFRSGEFFKVFGFHFNSPFSILKSNDENNYLDYNKKSTEKAYKFSHPLFNNI